MEALLLFGIFYLLCKISMPLPVVYGLLAAGSLGSMVIWYRILNKDFGLRNKVAAGVFAVVLIAGCAAGSILLGYLQVIARLMVAAAIASTVRYVSNRRKEAREASPE